MAAPTLSSISNTETTITVVFNQTISVPTAQYALGFTILNNGAAITAATAALNGGVTGIVYTFTTPIRQGDTVTVAYSNAGNNVRDFANTTTAASFSATASTNNSALAALLGSTVANTVGNENKIYLTFSSKVVSGTSLATGVAVTVNGGAATVSSVAASGDPRTLIVTLSAAVDYNDVVVLTYTATPGDWTSNSYVVPSFSTTCVNGSTIGFPNTTYPLSLTQIYPLVITANGVLAQVAINLNLVDRLLVSRYAPVQINIGGTFGVTMSNPAGVVVLGALVTINDGYIVNYTFTNPTSTAYAAAAATEWQTTMVSRIGVALGTIRTLDESITIGSTIYTSV